MKLFRFSDEFCADTRPYWVLFAGFAISIALLVYTLYTRQPERYRGIWQLFVGTSLVSPSAPDIQMAAYAPPPVPRNAVPVASALPIDNAMDRAPLPTPSSAEFLGMTLVETKDERKSQLAGETPRPGVVVAAILTNSLSYWAGLREGDLITSMNRRPTPAVTEFQRVAADLDASQGVLFDVFRRGKPCYITIDAQNNVR